ncbi:uncharacterized protein CTRU02_205171 [Colletotrichum truncatum]|uniref:Uncharacterized protein n=1 Tax=Colletotrichum truncatum TaxID=5467 RepID=A0ACC3Z3C5_COLTU|nr:uncharacterized protein CTRU02_06009 [Colletotrichum truncatum]KAF6793137.1 hypothetical protein CTRU02_06009 [Colletotrichum truncatum]
MRAAAILPVLFSLAAAAPATSQIKAREIVYTHTWDTWPDQSYIITPAARGFIRVFPTNATHESFIFGNLQAPNSGVTYTYTLSGQGIDTVVTKALSPGVTETHVIETTTNSPAFTISVDRYGL